MEHPDVFNLSRVDWSLFVTLTWRREGVQIRRKRSYWFLLVRKVAYWSGIHFRDVLWMLRTEYGEKADREHYHALIGGLPPAVRTLGMCHAVQELWEHLGPKGQFWTSRVLGGQAVKVQEMLSRDCGMSKVRIYDPNGNALEYSCPSGQELFPQAYSSVNGANRYEVNKFGAASAVEYSLSLLRWMRRYGSSGGERCVRAMGSSVAAPLYSLADSPVSETFPALDQFSTVAGSKPVLTGDRKRRAYEVSPGLFALEYA